jgi:cytochrome P450
MADMTFGEPLGMLDNGDYVPWVKFIFGLLKTATRIKVARYLSSWCDAGASIVKIHGAGLLPGVFHALTEHFRYMCERVDRRTQRHSAPTDADIWSLVDTDAKATATVLTAPERHSMVNELMIAGTETTATALSGTIYHLLRSPAHLATLTTHLRARYASVHDLDMASLQADRLLDAVLREGLRLFPPLPSGLPRVVPPEGAHLEPSSSSSWSESPEVFVPGGARVAVYHKPTYQWPAYFHRADEFHPERWMREDGAFAHDRLDAVEPFSVGPRNCIGKVGTWWLELSCPVLFFTRVLTRVVIEFRLA